MNAEVRVSARAHRRWESNPISGHSWPVYGPITGYEVRGPFGLVSTHRTEAAAERAAQAEREWYEKHPI